MKVTYGEIESIAKNLSDYSTAMSDILKEVTALFSKIGPDGTVWSGDAATNVKNEFDALSGKFDLFHETIKKCSDHLYTVVNNYRAVDNAVNSTQQ